MLKYMGIVCIQGNGEAEAMCAYLNEDNMVAGCISQDSDCFAYGAKVVFRNFSISHQGSFAASGGAVDIYDIQKANESLSFGRNKIIALALLCGSDYNEGVHGVGKDSALKFMNKYKDNEILERMRSWRTNNSLFSEMEDKINNKNICSSCGHFGKVQSHSKSGCGTCGTSKGCDFTKFREERLEIKNEIQIRNKALLDPQFPNETLINEYLIKKDNVTELDLKWRQPNLINFVKFTVKYLGWEEIYAFEKLLPILTRWQIKNFKLVFDKLKRNSISEIKGIIFPLCIKKVRNPKGVPSYEIIWQDKHNYFEHLIPEDQLEEYKESKKDGLEALWSTIEPQNLVEAAYPNLVEEFWEKKNKKGKKPTKRQKSKQADEINSITNHLLNTSISEPKPKKSRKKTTKEPILNPQPCKKIDSYFPRTKVEQLKQQQKHEINYSFDLDSSKFGDEEEDLDLSEIVNDIVNKSPKLPDKIKKLGYEIVLTHKMNLEKGKNLNESCFFDNNYDKVDLFEKTFDKNCLSDSDSENSVENIEEKIESGNELNDTFDDNYVPLLDRIKKSRLQAKN